MTEPTHVPKPNNPWRTVAILACVIAVSALAIAAVAVAVNLQRTNEIIAARADSRVAACHQDNAKTDQINGILIKVSTPPDGVTVTPSQQARIDSFRELEIPQRDCSPKGIAAYYAKKAP